MYKKIRQSVITQFTSISDSFNKIAIANIAVDEKNYIEDFAKKIMEAIPIKYNAFRLSRFLKKML